jgi:hypothetical protein
MLKIIYGIYLLILFSFLTFVNNKLVYLHFIFSQGTATEDYFNEAMLQRIRRYIRKIVFFRVRTKEKMLILKDKIEGKDVSTI